MKRLLERLFLIKEEEAGKTFLSLLLLFSTASTVIMIRSTGDALFLSNADLKQLPVLYIIVAVITAAASYFYALIADRIPCNRITVAFFALYALSFAVLYASIIVEVPHIFTIFYVYSNVVVLLLMLQTWTFISELFDTRQAKRLFGFIGFGGTAAGIICGFGIRGFTRYFQSRDLIAVCSGMLVFGIIITMVLKSVAGYTFTCKKQSRKTDTVSFGAIFKSRYLVTIALIISFTAIGSSMADYIFKVAAKNQYSGDELTSFFGFFYALTNIITFCYVLFFSSRMMTWLGVRNASLALPLDFIIGSIFYWVAPGIPAAGIMKFGDIGLRYTIHNEVRQVLLLPLKREIRGGIKAYMNGIVKTFAGALAGFILLIVSWCAAGDSLRIFAGILGGVSLIWLILSLPLNKGYARALYDSLDMRKINLKDFSSELNEGSIMRAIERELASEDEHNVIYSLELLRDLESENLAAHYRRLIKTGSDGVVRYIAGQIEQAPEQGYLADLKTVLAEKPGLAPSVVRALAACAGEKEKETVQGFSKDPHAGKDALVAMILYLGPETAAAGAEEVKLLADSNEQTGKKTAARIIGETGFALFRESAHKLFRQGDGEIRRELLTGAALDHDPRDLGMVIEGLFDPRVKAIALKSLPSFEHASEKVLDSIAAAGMVRQHYEALIDALGRIPNRQAADFLMGQAASAEAGIALRSAHGLAHICSLEPSLKPKPEAVHAAVFGRTKELFGIMIAAQAEEIRATAEVAALLQSAADERLEQACTLLGIVYGGEELKSAFMHITAKKSTANAIELIDARVRWKGKTFLAACLETKPEKLKEKYKALYKEEAPSAKTLLAKIHDRVLNALGLFLDQSTTDRGGKNMLSTIERVLFLKGTDIFKELSGEYLLHIAETASEAEFRKGETLCTDGEADTSLFIIVSGEVRVEKDGKEIARLGTSKCIGEMGLLDSQPRSADVRAASDVTALKIEQDDFYGIISENINIVKGIFKILTTRLRSMLEAEKNI